MQDQKILRAKSRQMLKEYGDVLEHAVKEIIKESESERVSEDTAFLYAKKAIKKECVRDTLLKLQAKINKYAEGN